MKATLEFELPEERTEYLQAVHAIDMIIAITNADNKLRGYVKYGDGTIQEAERVIDETRDILCEWHNLID